MLEIGIQIKSNGKSLINNLFQEAFGEYCIKFPITLFTGKRSASNAASPEVAMSKGKRYGYTEEPGEDEGKINVGLMKEYTGGDTLKARGLFKDPIEFKPQFKILLLCNDLPSVPPYDRAVWRRMEVVEFMSYFTDDPVEENEFQIDKRLPEKIKLWKEAFMSLLLEYYKKYLKDGLIIPKEVKKYTEEYQKQCDIYSDYLNAVLKKTNSADNVDMSQFYRDFKSWGLDNNIGKILSLKEFKIYIEKKFGKKSLVGNSLKGYVLLDRTLEQNEDENFNDGMEGELKGGFGAF